MVSKPAIDFAKKLCKTYNVKLELLKGYVNGYAKPKSGVIVVGTAFNNDIVFISCVIHEIQHCLNHRNKKYWQYHRSDGITKKVGRRWGLQAELYTEDQAEKLAKKHGIDNYYRFYNRNDDGKSKRFIKEYFS